MFITKRILIITGAVVAIVMLALGVGLAYAFTAYSQQSSSYANLSATATAGVATPAKKGAPNGQHRVLGVIQSLGNQSFVLQPNKGKKAITVNVTAQTKYTNAGQNVSFSDLKVGETIAVMGMYDAQTSTLQATRIVISPKLPALTPTVSTTATATP